MAEKTLPGEPGVRPYATDIEYLMDLVGWIQVRANRIVRQRELNERDAANPLLASRRGRNVYRDALPGSVEELLERETSLLVEIDGRAALNRATGPALGLDRLCRQHGLNDVERMVLLLGFVPCLGSDFCATGLSKVDSIVTSALIHIEMVNLFMELDLSQGLKSLLCIAPGAPLRENNLIRLSYEPQSPSDACGVGIELSPAAVAVMTGIPEFVAFAAPQVQDGEE